MYVITLQSAHYCTLMEPCLSCFTTTGILFTTVCVYVIIISTSQLHFHSWHVTLAQPTINCPEYFCIACKRKKTILYVERCEKVFCEEKPINLQPNNPDIQCVWYRTGLQCGHCPPDLSATLVPTVVRSVQITCCGCFSL